MTHMMKWLVKITYDEVENRRDGPEWRVCRALTQGRALARMADTYQRDNIVSVEVVGGFGMDMTDEEILATVE